MIVYDIYGRQYDASEWRALRQARGEDPNDLDALSEHMQGVGYGPLDFTKYYSDYQAGNITIPAGYAYQGGQVVPAETAAQEAARKYEGYTSTSTTGSAADFLEANPDIKAAYQPYPTYDPGAALQNWFNDVRNNNITSEMSSTRYKQAAAILGEDVNYGYSTGYGGTETYDTVNGPKTLAKMADELYALGWPGGEDVATAYARTTGGAVTLSGTTTGTDATQWTATGGTTTTLPTPTYGTTPDVTRWFEERPQSYLTYLMEQQGIKSGSPLGQYISEQYYPASLQHRLAFAKAAARGAAEEGLPTMAQFIPEYAAGNVGRMGLADLTNIAAAGNTNELVQAALDNLKAQGQLQVALEALAGGSSGPFLRWIAQEAAEPLQRQWEASVPTSESAATKNYLQYNTS